LVFDPVAQLVEQHPFKVMVAGSNPAWVTMDNPKYSVDQTILINNFSWRVAGYNFRFGKEWQYTLQLELTDGTYKTIYLNETAIDEIVDTQSQGEDPII
tara:strand:+ start:10693 stop:10989 length:297 start_codon:yes stop_codon:yes gene_type:complete